MWFGCGLQKCGLNLVFCGFDGVYAKSISIFLLCLNQGVMKICLEDQLK